jgi:hypothetical protein
MYFDKEELQDSENGLKVMEIADGVGVKSADPTNNREEKNSRIQFKKPSLRQRSPKQLLFLLRKESIGFNMIMCLPKVT